MNQGNVPSDTTQDTELDWVQVLEPIRRHWAQCLVIWFVATGLIGVGALHLSPQFTSTSAIYFQSPQQSLGLGSVSPMLSSLAGEGSNIADQERILKSNDMARAVIREVGLNATLTGPSSYLPLEPFYWQWKIDEDLRRFKHGLRATHTRLAEDRYEAVVMQIVMQGPSNYSVEIDGQPLMTGRLGEPTTVGDATFTLSYTDALGRPLTQGARFELEIEPAAIVVEDLLESIALDSGMAASPSDVLRVSCTLASPFEAKRVLEVMLRRYQTLTRRWTDQFNRMISETMDRHIAAIRTELEQAMRKRAKFQAQTGVVSLEPQVKEDVEALVTLEVELRAVMMQISELERIEQSLKTGNEVYLSAFIEQPVFEELVAKIATLNQEIASLAAEYQDSYPPLRQRRAARDALGKDLRVAINNYETTARSQARQMREQIEQMRGNLLDLPEKVRDLLALTQATEVWEKMLIALVAEQQRAQITEDTAPAKFQRLDDPSMPLLPSSPQMPLVAIIGIIVGLIIAVGTVTLRYSSWTGQSTAAAAGQPPQQEQA